MKTGRREKMASQVPVSLGGRVLESSLPLQWVEYPRHYGTFFRFARSQEGPYLFCDCYSTALRNLIALNNQRARLNRTVEKAYACGLDFSVEFEREFSAEKQIESLFQLAEPQLCHRCNGVPPSRRYCHEMYGGAWKQSFGWYINLASIENGIGRDFSMYLSSHIPEELRPQLESLNVMAARRAFLVSQLEEESSVYTLLRDLDKEKAKIRRSISRYFENQARSWFGFRAVGDAWVSETLLFQLIQLLLPTERIHRHHRPLWLEGLELDIYIPRLNLGFEYQGQQHAKPVEHWGGRRALESQKVRDRKKKQLCAEYGCRLIEIWYDDPISIELIRERMISVGAIA